MGMEYEKTVCDGFGRHDNDLIPPIYPLPFTPPHLV
jgi:hypothetical protein